jgi:2-polyprenyl-6-methoxyphenol hydroxylase-like FAD-dependent oxidoreductase
MTQAEAQTDVIVAGAGPTGLMLAGELALAGVRARVVERRPEPSPHSRALTLHPRSVEVMDMRGLAPRFLAAASTTVPGYHFAVLDTRLDFRALDTRHGYTLFLPQLRTEALLEQRARELGVRIERGYEVRGLAQDAAGVDVVLRDGAGRDTTARARYVVGCDGGRSTVRQAAGIGFPGTDESLTGMLGDFAVFDATPEAREAAGAAGVLAAPLEDGLTRVVCVDPARMRVPSGEPVTLEEFRAALVRLCGHDLGIADPRWLSRFGNSTRLADRYREGRVLVAGDAAHIHFPAAGQGLNTGLQDAMNLGWKLAAEIGGWAGPGLLDSYDGERRPVGRAVTGNTEIQTLLAELPLTPAYGRPGTALRALFDELLRIEEVNRLLAERVSAIGTAYAPPAGADPLVGRRMPDIALTTAETGATRVYELLARGRFVRIVLAGDGQRGSATGETHPRVTAVDAVSYDDHAVLRGVHEVLVRPDGHLAWVSRTGDPAARETERKAALAEWVGA